MLIIISLAAITVVGLVLSKIMDEETLPWVLVKAFELVSAVSLVVALIALLACQISCPAVNRKNESTYETIYYQLLHHLYDNENCIGKKQLADQIMDWNRTLLYNREMKNNLWTNWFYPEDYGSLNFIPLELLDREDAL